MKNKSIFSSGKTKATLNGKNIVFETFTISFFFKKAHFKRIEKLLIFCDYSPDSDVINNKKFIVCVG